MEVPDFAAFLYDYCSAFSGSVTSWVRTVSHNHAVRGVPASPHLRGLAADVIYDGARPGLEADRWLAQRGLRRLVESDHDHIQPADWRIPYV